jgi:GT2 family glycosyltransferase
MKLLNDEFDAEHPMKIKPSVRGAITGLYGDVLQGWAIDDDHTETRIVVEVFADGQSVGFARAEAFIQNPMIGDGFHGFAMKIQERYLTNARQISARVANVGYWLCDGIALSAPRSAGQSNAASQVWHTGGLKIYGWAWDTVSPNRNVTINVIEHGQKLTSTVANLAHHSLSYLNTNDHAFELDLPWQLADGRVHTLTIENDRGEPLSGSPITVCTWPEGIEGILRNKKASELNDPDIQLLAEVAKQHELILPKSAGFNHYHEWYEAFQSAPPMLHDQPVNCGILVLTKKAKELEAISMASLVQRHPAKAIECCSSDDVVDALKSLQSQGCRNVIPVMAGDRLAPFALDQLQELMIEGVDWAYGDCDCDDISGRRTAPWLKPAWDIDLFIGEDVFSPGAIFSMSAVNAAIDLTENCKNEGKLSWDMFLAGIALSTVVNSKRVMHLPRVVYHRSNRLARTPAEDPKTSSRRESIAWLVQCLSSDATLDDVTGYPGLLRARWPLPEVLPRVTIMIPTRDQVDLLRTCVEGVLGHTDYDNLEVIIVDNDSSDTRTLAYLAELESRGVHVLPHPYPFNYPAVNNRAAEIATGRFLCLLNNDIEILEADWLKELVSQALRPGVGAVGAKLLWANGMVQHGGVTIGINGLAAHAGNSSARQDAGYLGMNQVVRCQSSVTGACMLTPRDIYLELGGMDENSLPIAFNDVDLCLRIRERGLKVLWTPFAELIHAESASRGKDSTVDRIARGQREQRFFRSNWTDNGQVDDYYHPGLSHDYQTGPYGGLALPPRPLSTVRGLDKPTASRKPLRSLHALSLKDDNLVRTSG